MPRGDRTGPNGAGALSGRRMGFCAGNNVPGYQANESNYYERDGGFGFRHRFGRGGNRGFGENRFQYGQALYPCEPIDKKSQLKDQIESLRGQLSTLEKEFDKLK